MQITFFVWCFIAHVGYAFQLKGKNDVQSYVYGKNSFLEK